MQCSNCHIVFYSHFLFFFLEGCDYQQWGQNNLINPFLENNYIYLESNLDTDWIELFISGLICYYAGPLHFKSKMCLFDLTLSLLCPFTLRPLSGERLVNPTKINHLSQISNLNPFSKFVFPFLFFAHLYHFQDVPCISLKLMKQSPICIIFPGFLGKRL